MNLEPSDDQRLLKDLVDRFTADAGGMEARRMATRSDIGWSRETWARMAELGLLAVSVAEDAGGLGGGGVELMIVGEATGRSLLTAPFLDGAVVPGAILSGADGDAREAALAGLLDGSLVFALVDRGVAGSADGLTGSAIGITGAGAADCLIVQADGALYLVMSDAPGLTRDDYPLHGGGRAADLRFDGVRGTPLLGGDGVAALLSHAGERRTVFLAAEALGAAEAAFETTVDYLKMRLQFGKVIGTNQALQHRAAEMLVELEQLRSAAILAACTLDDPDADERAKVMAAVSLVVAKTTRFIAQQAVQLHGGIGVTEEHVVGQWFLRLTAIGLLLAVDGKAAMLAERGGFVAAAPYWDTAA